MKSIAKVEETAISQIMNGSLMVINRKDEYMDIIRKQQNEVGDRLLCQELEDAPFFFVPIFFSDIRRKSSAAGEGVEEKLASLGHGVF